ncbi:MAG: retropepsin-like aspartic protease, partial [Terriglobales bacterium]
ELGLKFSSMPALIDTGAQRTVVSPEAIAKVGLSKINETKLLRLGGFTEQVGAYVASIQFPRGNLATIEVIEVASCELPHPLIRCLLGRDVLSRWVFTYNGPLGAWQISEESVAPWIDPPEGIDLWGQ